MEKLKSLNKERCLPVLRLVSIVQHDMSEVRIKVSEHARTRCSQSHVPVGFLIKEVSQIPKFKGKIRWMTKLGVIVIEMVNEGLILIKTFIAKFKYKGGKYHKGCTTF